jgi:hypothetical protein
MRDREHGNVISEPYEHDVIRKVVHWKPANIGTGDARNERTSPRKAFEVVKRLTDFSGKTTGYFGVPFAIPRYGFPKLATSAFANANPLQRVSTSR